MLKLAGLRNWLKKWPGWSGRFWSGAGVVGLSLSFLGELLVFAGRVEFEVMFEPVAAKIKRDGVEERDDQFEHVTGGDVDEELNPVRNIIK